MNKVLVVSSLIGIIGVSTYVSQLNYANLNVKEHVSEIYGTVTGTSDSVKIKSDSYKDLGIQLNKDILKTYTAGDSLLLEGTVLNGEKTMMVFLKNKTTQKQVTNLVSVGKDNKFKMPVSLPLDPGDYYLIISSGTSFHTTQTQMIKLVNTTVDTSKIKVIGTSEMPSIVYERTPYVSIGDNMYGILSIKQGGKSQVTKGNIFTFDNLKLVEGSSSVSIIKSINTTGTPDLSQSTSVTSNVVIDHTRELFGQDKVTFKKVGATVIMQFKLKKGQQVKSEYFLTKPNQSVEKFTFKPEYIEKTGYLKTDITIQQSFSIPTSGVYKIETVQSNGLAYFNLPISKDIFWSIVKPLTTAQEETLSSNTTSVRMNTTNDINKVRKSLGLKSLSTDQTLTNLAQKKAEDMAKYDYVGHVTKGGLSIMDFAKSINIVLKNTSIGENVAGGNVSDLSLQLGLKESGSHLYNMTSVNWKSVGVGDVLKDGKTYIVQIFGN